MLTRDATLIDLDARAVPATSDEALLMDEEAFRGFYERTSRLVWVYLHRLTGDRTAADDLLQESYYRLLRTRASFENEAHRRRYLFRIATNLVRDRSRRVRTRPTEVESVGDMAVPATTATRALDDRLDVKQAMSRMDPRERALIWLAYSEGASHREIAEIVGVRVSSVKTLLFRARRRLARMLARPRRS
jgi:RNA polymerase sigma-70 factor, ECF subfamily